ncbi:phosphoglycerate kinase [Candidatus Micrarchaeota archaeon]|nr:phosphoglycerate kinase [Candidatus Micrarchaeota archaeon]
MKNLDDFDFNEKRVLLRLDLNSPVIDGVVQDNERFAAHSETVKELLKKNASVIIIAHQGRPGDKDFVSLEQHAELLSKHVKKKVKFVSDLFGDCALSEIAKLKPGRALLLENLRFYSEELVEKNFENTVMVSRLSKACDVFVDDAFSVAHRVQTSIVGFPKVMPSFAGRVMQREYAAISKAISNIERPYVMVLGGSKPDDVVKLLKHALSAGTADKILCSGVIGELLLLAKGEDLGYKSKWLEQQGYTKNLPELKTLVEKYSDKLVLPTDFALKDRDGIRLEVLLKQLPSVANTESSMPGDIGSKTAYLFDSAIQQAKTVYYKGPQGIFEEPAFELGTRSVLKSIASCKGFVLMGGGHSLTALDKFNVSKKKVSHISIAGGALIAMLCGESLPGVEVLQ